MSADELKVINRIIRNAWKALAEDTEGDYDTTLETAKTVLNELEELLESEGLQK